MDRKRIIGEVAARHGVRLEEDDPAFMLVTIAELALKDAQQDFLNASALQINVFEKALERVQRLAGESLGKSLGGEPVRHLRDADPPNQPELSDARSRFLWFGCGFVCAWLVPLIPKSLFGLL